MKNINKPTTSIQIPIVEKSSSNERTNLVVRVLSTKNTYSGGGGTFRPHTIPPDEHSR